MYFDLSDSFVFMLGDCVNFRAIRYNSSSFNRIIAEKSHRVILALLILVLPHPTFFRYVIFLV